MIRNVIRESEYETLIFLFEHTVGSYICEGIYIYFVFTRDTYFYLYISMYGGMCLSLYPFINSSTGYQMIASLASSLLLFVSCDLG